MKIKVLPPPFPKHPPPQKKRARSTVVVRLVWFEKLEGAAPIATTHKTTGWSTKPAWHLPHPTLPAGEMCGTADERVKPSHLPFHHCPYNTFNFNFNFCNEKSEVYCRVRTYDLSTINSKRYRCAMEAVRL